MLFSFVSPPRLCLCVCLRGRAQGGNQGLTVVIHGQGQTTGQLQLIPPGVTVIPSPGQQLMQAAMPNGQVQRFLFTPGPVSTQPSAATPTQTPASAPAPAPAPAPTATAAVTSPSAVPASAAPVTSTSAVPGQYSRSFTRPHTTQAASSWTGSGIGQKSVTSRQKCSGVVDLLGPHQFTLLGLNTNHILL